MLSRSFFTFLFAVLIGGCVTVPLAVAIAEPKTLPTWIDRPVNSDALYMYGVAVGVNRDDAIKAALTDMTSKLGTTIESLYESSEEVQGSYYHKLSVNNKINSRVEKIKVNNYEVVKSFRVSYKEFAVMIRTDKNKFVSGLKESLKREKKSIEDELSLLNGNHALSRYNTLKRLDEKSQELYSDVIIISELDRGFKKDKYLDFISKSKVRFLKEKNALNFYIYGDKKSQKFIETIKALLSKDGFNIVDKSHENSVHVRFKTTETLTRSNSMNIAVLSINIDVFSNEQTIGGKTLIIKERYNGSQASLYKNASIHFEEDIKSQGINELIGINIDLD